MIPIENIYYLTIPNLLYTRKNNLNIFPFQILVKKLKKKILVKYARLSIYTRDIYTHPETRHARLLKNLFCWIETSHSRATYPGSRWPVSWTMKNRPREARSSATKHRVHELCHVQQFTLHSTAFYEQGEETLGNAPPARTMTRIVKRNSTEESTSKESF